MKKQWVRSPEAPFLVSFNSFAFKAMENTTVFCKMRGNTLMSSWLTRLGQVLQLQDCDLHHILSYFQIDLSTTCRGI